MMMTIRNTDCDDEMYQVIKDCLNDSSINKQLKKTVDSFTKFETPLLTSHVSYSSEEELSHRARSYKEVNYRKVSFGPESK